MRRRLSHVAWLVVFAAVILIVVGNIASGIAPAPQQKVSPRPKLTPGQAPQKKGVLRPKLTPVQRFERSLAKSPRQGLLVPALIHSIERYLQGATDLSEMDRIVQGAIRRHPGVSRQMLQTWVNNWKAIPATTKVKIVPAELRNLNPTQKLDMTLFRTTVKRAAEQAARNIQVDWGLAKSTLGKTLDTNEQTRLPYITSIQPVDSEGIPSFRLGQTFTIYGKRFSKEARNVQIHLLRYVVTGVGLKSVAQLQLVMTLNPKIATPTALRAEVPKPEANEGGRRGMVRRILKGRYQIQVETRGYGKSNLAECEIEPPPQPLPATHITSIEPAAQYPGKEVIIRGNNFPSPEFLWWESVDYEGVYYHWMPVQSASATELRLTVPQDVLPGTYRFCANGARGWSEWKTFTVRAPVYRVTFNTIKCLDESDPEANCSDEIVTMWAVCADGYVWTKQTGEYEDFDDGDEKTYHTSDRTVYVPDGGAREVRQFLLINTSLYEWDYGTAEAGEAVFGFCGDILSALQDELGEGVLAVGLPVVIPFGVVGLICELVDTVVNWFGGEPDSLGKMPLAWTAVQLQLQTANPSGSFSGALDFNNDDDTGSYRLRYTVVREDPR